MTETCITCDLCGDTVHQEFTNHGETLVSVYKIQKNKIKNNENIGDFPYYIFTSDIDQNASNDVVILCPKCYRKTLLQKKEGQNEH